MINFSTWRNVWQLLSVRERKHALLMLMVIVFGSLSAAAMVGSIVPFLTVLANPDIVHSNKLVADVYAWLGFQSYFDFLLALGGVSIGVILIANAIQILRVFVVERYAEGRVLSFSMRLLSVYLRQPYEFFLNRHSGDLTMEILNESLEVSNRFIRPVAELIASALTVVCVVGMLVVVKPVVAVSSMAVIGGLYLIIYLAAQRLATRLGYRRVEAEAARYRYSSEAFGGIKDIKILGKESYYLDRFSNPAAALAKIRVMVALIWQVPYYVLQVVAFGGIIAICLLLTDASQATPASALGTVIPTLGLFAFAGQRLMPEIQKVYGALAVLRYSEAAVRNYHRDVMLESNAENLVSGPVDSVVLVDNIELRRISYRFPGAEEATLRDISLSIRRGEKIGIIGATGAGKTTLADLLLGLLRPSAGTILVDGTEIGSANLRAWQRNIGYVPQSIYLSDASIAENIALGNARADIDDKKLVACAKIAQIHDFITSELPDGYEMVVGERGVRLSGGQRQRLGIARALYHDAGLIIFDEATSALDNLTERELVRAIEALPGDKTLIIIAHRLSTVKACDRIAFMDKGEVLAFGSWDDTWAANAKFRELVALI